MLIKATPTGHLFYLKDNVYTHWFSNSVKTDTGNRTVLINNDVSETQLGQLVRIVDAIEEFNDVEVVERHIVNTQTDGGSLISTIKSNGGMSTLKILESLQSSDLRLQVILETYPQWQSAPLTGSCSII